MLEKFVAENCTRNESKTQTMRIGREELPSRLSAGACPLARRSTEPKKPKILDSFPFHMESGKVIKIVDPRTGRDKSMIHDHLPAPQNTEQLCDDEMEHGAKRERGAKGVDAE